MKSWVSGIRGKLILIFVVIKVLPLLVLAAVAWTAAQRLGDALSERATGMADGMLTTIKQVGDTVTGDAIRALDDRSREAIERLTTDTAAAVAQFLYDRDADVRQASQVEPSEAAYREFLRHRQRSIHAHGPWRLAQDQSKWEPATTEGPDATLAANAAQALPDNARNFNARPPEYRGQETLRPLYAEMSFVDVSGREKFKVVTDGLMTPQLRDVRDRANTFVKAEDYWPELQKLKPGQIYVSEVIGAYVGSRLVGMYTPAAAQKAGIAFEPEKSAYAGTENPVGKRYRGIVRWAMPVVRGGRVVGYVTLALDHEHLRQFTDRISPNEARYTPIIDAIEGNYAFMWDHKSRAIAHPRDYFMPGYDPATGHPVTPWLDQALYEQWQASGQPSHEFLKTVEPFRKQSLQLKPAAAMVRAGTVALDCRYLNFSPQCTGFQQLTEKGGSGSFVIFFSGLWKLTTAATIPYYTGQYANSPRGFGFVTIGANVDDFHRAASESAKTIGHTIATKDAEFKRERQGMLATIEHNLTGTATALTISTLIMVVLVIAIAVWMAQFLSVRITSIISGIEKFQAGDLAHRLEVRSTDEMGQLAMAFNHMADGVQESFQRSEAARVKAEEANQVKSDFLAGVSHELRTPLNGILGFADLLEMDLQDESQRDYASTIKRSGQHLLDIVNDLLDLAKVEAGRLDLYPEGIALRAFCAELIVLHRSHAQGKGLAMHMEFAEDLPGEFVADSQRLKQILNNLLNNAIKFTEQGDVRLTVSIDQTEINFEVRDTGCGIAPESHKLVFDKFRQAQGFMARNQGGTGLGLSLARQLARRMGGRITLQSALGQGASFTLSLPRSFVDKVPVQ